MRTLSWSMSAVIGCGLAALAPGCGNPGDGPGPDAIPPDASPPDASTPDDEPEPPEMPRDPNAPVNVAADHATISWVSRKVAFQNPDGSTIFESEVDGSDHAQAVMPLGGTVTSIVVSSFVGEQPDAIAVTITSVRGVKPGDDISFIGARTGCDLIGGERYTDSRTARVPQATILEIGTSCGFADGGDPVQGAATARLPVDPASPIDVLVVASGGSLAVPQFFGATGLSHPTQALFTIPGSFAPMQPFAIRMTNVPASIAGLSATRATFIGNAPVSPQGVVSSDPPAGAFSLPVPYPPGVGVGNETELVLQRAELPSMFEQRISRTVQPASGVDIDLGKLRLPLLSNVAMTNTGVTWTASEIAGRPDGMRVTWDGRFDNGVHRVLLTWIVIDRFDPTGMTLPSLPAEDADIDPAQHPGVFQLDSASVTIADYNNVGYDDLRQLPNDLLDVPVHPVAAFPDTAFQGHIVSAGYRRRQ